MARLIALTACVAALTVGRSIPVSAADSAVAAAVREALHFSVERAVANVGRPGGFGGNAAIRIPIPEQLSKVEAVLRQTGQDKRADRFIESLNQAAEEASPSSRSALLGGVADLALHDAHRVLIGADTSATDLLRRLAFGRTVTTLGPAVADALGRSGATRRYHRLVRDSPFGGLVPPVDLEAYVSVRTAEGIFHAIGMEERRIRIDPAARPTARLREFFGAHR